ncbi:D-ribose pyranase [Yersinia entomophaga]|uniref:D-ribose pyranase n=2 Tax=Yersinia TaxID=629 RepID=A0ABN4PUQ1_YERET|nr:MULTISPECIES: D-ribose pyranase [Yersinia]ANI30673.1 D-ribose pyranase [Yersinia entomophaga]MDN0086970.1 D-ribose pyranase [Yersinia nurmii]OWF88039.1 D-ribose pyranase [Yersinia entomophaga]CNE31929.1 D-ribose pyranase [Yersinia nurmii]
MKKGVLLNSDISAVISRLGHTDQIVIADAGLPIPASTTRIDLALTQGVPGFLQVLSVVTQEMQVESAILAEEIAKNNPQLHEALLTQLKQLEQHQGNSIALHYVSHEAFKEQTKHSHAVIRSGECSPFANVILCAGVTF